MLVETPELRRAREFLNDTQIFIASGVSIDRIGEVAGAAAKLRIALDNLDEAAAIEWMSRLHNFLDPMEGFTVFLQRRLEERRQEQVRRLAVASAEAERNTQFIDAYLRAHIGDKTTEQMLKQRERLRASLSSQSVDEVERANETFKTYVDDNALRDAHDGFVASYGKPPTHAAPQALTLEQKLGIRREEQVSDRRI